jgi:hypothetical protein
MFLRVTGAPIGKVTPTSAIFTDIHRMTGHLIQVCARPMALSRAGPRPECQHAPTAVEIGVRRLGSSKIAFIRAHLVLGSFWNAQQPSPSRWRWIRRRPQFDDQSQNLGEQHSWHGDLGHPEGDIATGLTTFAPILIRFSFRLVRDQFLIGSGVASVRKKLPKL